MKIIEAENKICHLTLGNLNRKCCISNRCMAWKWNTEVDPNTQKYSKSKNNGVCQLIEKSKLIGFEQCLK
jgi:hypothetical protein